MIISVMFDINYEVSFSSSFRILRVHCALIVKFLISIFINFILNVYAFRSYDLESLIIIK